MPDHLRIAQLANFVGPASGGMKTAVQALGRGYVESGAQRLLILPGPRDERASTAEGDVLQLRSPSVSGGYRLIIEPWRVIAALAAFRPTSLEVSDKSTLLPVTGWARRQGVPGMLFSHERLDAMVSLRIGSTAGVTRSVTALYHLLMRRFDAIVVTSSYARGEFAHVAAVVDTPVHQIALGVDLETFRPLPNASGTQEPLRLVHVGRLSREKSPHLAVAAAVELHRRGVPVRLDVYGDGPQRRQLQRLADRAPVVFHGHIASGRELSEGLARADVALSPCPGETFGLAVLEALASGTPVVTADTGGARELIDQQSGAWAAAEPAAMADAVLEVAARPVRQRRTAARRRAERYPWARSVEDMLLLHAQAGSRRAVSAEPA